MQLGKAVSYVYDQVKAANQCKPWFYTLQKLKVQRMSVYDVDG